jgi:hypothetical protein
LNFSASSTNFSISVSDNLPLSFLISILLVLLLDLSSAVTFRIPLASTSKVTSICGVPLGAGGIPLSSNLPNKLLSLVKVLSPSNT